MHLKLTQAILARTKNETQGCFEDIKTAHQLTLKIGTEAVYKFSVTDRAIQTQYRPGI